MSKMGSSTILPIILGVFFHNLYVTECVLEVNEIDLQPILDQTTENEFTLGSGLYFCAQTVNIASGKSMTISPGTKIRFVEDAGIEIQEGGHLNLNCSAEDPCHLDNLDFLRVINGTLLVKHVLITNCSNGVHLMSDHDQHLQYLTIKDSAGIRLQNSNPSAKVNFQNLQMIDIDTDLVIGYVASPVFVCQADLIVHDSLFLNIKRYGIGPAGHTILNHKFYMEVTNTTFTAMPNSFGLAIRATTHPRVNITANTFHGFGFAAVEARLRTRETTLDDMSTWSYDNNGFGPDHVYETNYLTIENNKFLDNGAGVKFDVSTPHIVLINRNHFSGWNARKGDHQIKSLDRSDSVSYVTPRLFQFNENVFDSIPSGAVFLILTLMNKTEIELNHNRILNVSDDDCALISVYMNITDPLVGAPIPNMVQLNGSYNIFNGNSAKSGFTVYRFPRSSTTVDVFDASFTYNHFLGNTFTRGAMHGIDLHVLFQYNNIQDTSGSYTMIVPASERENQDIIQAPNNWWGTSHSDEIELKIKNLGLNPRPLITWLPFCKGDGHEYCDNFDDCVKMAKRQSEGEIFPCATEKTGFLNWIKEVVDDL